MQQCPTCGSLNPDDADVCADCGMELPGHGATPATPSPTPATPATPAATSFDFAPGSGAAPAASDAPAANPALTESASSDPFSGSEWNFDLNKEAPLPDVPTTPPTPSFPETPQTPETPATPETPMSGALDSAPTQLLEPAPSNPATPTPPATPSATGTAKLILKRGGAATGDAFAIGASATVGRFDPESGPVDVDMANLPEAVYISRHHAEVNLRDGQWMVKDLGSRNGTFVKNAGGFTRVTGETPIQNGDEVAFGNARFEFQIG